MRWTDVVKAKDRKELTNQMDTQLCKNTSFGATISNIFCDCESGKKDTLCR